MSDEKQKLEHRRNPHRRLDLNPSNKLLSKIIPWHVSLAIGEPISRLFEPPRKLIEPYVKRDQVVADLGCGRGYYSLALAKLVGQEGKVYAVDLDKRNIQTLEKRADKGGYHNIEAHASSASVLRFIKDRSIDFILANGLL
jgi:2-polyprenyl-3-methyl-5-hydroxy-6-metoxy-1,4-benzoquinol methylase